MPIWTRGTSHDAFARYTEKGDIYVEGMERLQRKFETAANVLPAPVIRPSEQNSLYGVIFYGTTDLAMQEALDLLKEQGIELDVMRIRAFPFCKEVFDFVEHHKRVFVVEQNRDAQMRMLIINEGDINPAKLDAVLHYNGMPITATFIVDSIAGKLQKMIPNNQFVDTAPNATPSKKGAK